MSHRLLRNRNADPKAHLRRSAWLFVALVAATASVGCTRAPNSPAAAPAQQLPAGSYSKSLDGLVVTIELPSKPVELAGGEATASLLRPVEPGKVRVIVHATAVNSTQATMSVDLDHLAPQVFDTSGDESKYLEAQMNMTTAESASDKEPIESIRWQEGLPPGAQLETVATFDFDSGQTGMRAVWALSGQRVAEHSLPAMK